MEIEIEITSHRIEVPPLPSRPHGAAGAWVEFHGIVRNEESGGRIAALEYEAYSPMAELEIRRILEQLALERPCLSAQVIHRTGPVPVGDAAIWVGIAAVHRADAFAMLSSFMDRLKADVPIWKVRALTEAELTLTKHS